MIAAHGKTALWWALAGIAALIVPGTTGVWRDGGPGALEANPVPPLAVIDGTDDLGLIDNGTKELRHEIRIQNNGGAVANILKIQTGCGCMDASVSPSRLEPGETARIALTLRVPPATKDLRKAIAIRTDLLGTPILTIPLHGRVESSLAISPRELRLEPAPASALPVNGEVLVSGVEGTLRVASLNGAVSASATALTGGRHAVRVTRDSGQAGKFQDTLVVTDSKSGAWQSFTVRGEVLPEVRFRPESVVFVEGGIGGDTVVVDVAWSRSSEDLASIQVPAGLKVIPSSEARPDRLEVAFDAVNWPGVDAGRVALSTSAGETYELPVYVMAGL